MAQVLAGFLKSSSAPPNRDFTVKPRPTSAQIRRGRGQGLTASSVTSRYESAPARLGSSWEVLGNGEIVASEDPLPQDAHLLDVWANRDSRGAWWLDAGKVLHCLASGGSVTDISRFLVEKSQNELPEAIEGWLSGIAAKASAVKGIESALLIEMC